MPELRIRKSLLTCCEFNEHYNSIAVRSLLTKKLANDFEIGVVIQLAKGSGRKDEVVEIGVRIPSVERVVESYELYRMNKMGFEKIEPVGWLTFWKPLTSLSELVDKRLPLSSVCESFIEFELMLESAIIERKEEICRCLLNAARPSWATLPASWALVQRAIIYNRLKFPENDGVVRWIAGRVGDMASYEAELDVFETWLSKGLLFAES